MKWLGNRLTERSTWASIVTLITLGGVSLVPELKEAIITAGVSVASLIFMVTKG